MEQSSLHEFPKSKPRKRKSQRSIFSDFSIGAKSVNGKYELGKRILTSEQFARYIKSEPIILFNNKVTPTEFAKHIKAESLRLYVLSGSFQMVKKVNSQWQYSKTPNFFKFFKFFGLLHR